MNERKVMVVCEREIVCVFVFVYIDVPLLLCADSAGRHISKVKSQLYNIAH